MRIFLSAIILTFVAIGGGCKRAPAAVEKPHNATPKDALLSLLSAMKEANADKVAAACKMTPEQRPIIDAGSNYTREVYKFRDAFIAAYGADAWDTFQDPAHRPGDHDTTFIIITDEALDKATKTEFQVDGDKATCIMPAGTGKVQLIKMPNGQWLADGSTFVPPGKTVEELRKMLDSLTAVVKKYEKAIGKPNIGPSDIDYELGREINFLISGITDTSRHRFEIDKL
jgi:hypothetical protein